MIEKNEDYIDSFLILENSNINNITIDVPLDNPVKNRNGKHKDNEINELSLLQKKRKIL